MNFTFRVGDVGRTRGGSEYVITTITGDNVFGAETPQPIEIDFTDGSLADFKSWSADGTFNPCRESCLDLMPPTHNTDGTQYTYADNGNQGIAVEVKPIAAEESQHHGLHPGEATHQFNEHGALELIPGVSLSDDGPTYEERLRDDVAKQAIPALINEVRHGNCDESEVASIAFTYADDFMAERARRYAKGN